MLPYLKVLASPEWWIEWIRTTLIPALGLEYRQLFFGAYRGALDFVLFVLVGLGLLTASQAYMNSQYALPRETQTAVIKWAPVAEIIAHRTDIPPEVPLVLWLKENSMKAENPESCTGIMGAYDLVRSGELPCFTPGPISDIEVTRQLAIGAEQFKERCPEISYWTQDEAIIKRCYFAYNAGAGAAARLDPNDSAYVMNNFSAEYEGMIYEDIELGTVQVTAMGAWPAHLAIQSMTSTQVDATPGSPLGYAVVDVSTRVYDWTTAVFSSLLGFGTGSSTMSFPASRSLGDAECLAAPPILGRPSLRPNLNPVTVDPILTQDVHGCSYNLPGLDISSNDTTAVLQAPMPGTLTTYTDQWRNSTIRIENDEWVIWMLHPRSYLISEGEVRRGQPVGVMGAVGYATGPHVHYTIYNKSLEMYVDPRQFLP